MESTLERVRAWALFNATNPEKAAQKISDLFTQGKEDYVVIRADVVHTEQGEFNLVVPVDAKDEKQLNVALKRLSAEAGPATVLEVVHHHPEDPHRAHSYVAPGEFGRFPQAEYAPPGRHRPKSPGANPWG